MENMKRITYILIVFLTSFAVKAHAKIDLVTLPVRDQVQLTIYNSADLTLACDSRYLTLKQGLNALQFSWENTLIDPTSLEMNPKMFVDKIDVFDLTFPPRVKNLGIFNINSEIAKDVPVEISYLTSGLSWRAFYLGTLNANETEMTLQGFVRVTNDSGEDYENAQVRLIVGKVNLIDAIAQLARRNAPYGSRVGLLQGVARGQLKDIFGSARIETESSAGGYDMSFSSGLMDVEEIKKIVKEGLSEYFLYTIEGRETIKHGWSKRLPSFTTEKIPVVNLYKYEQERYGNQVVRFLSFSNDEDHMLGETPIPGGVIKVFRNADSKDHLSYEGQSNFKYIPVKKDVELNLGNDKKVTIEPILMGHQTNQYQFDRRRNVSGWNEIQEFKVEVNNTKNIAVEMEIMRNFNTSNWMIANAGSFGEYEKVDKDTVKYTLNVPANSKAEFQYRLTIAHGTRVTKR
jgi:hypothetical protein